MSARALQHQRQQPSLQHQLHRNPPRLLNPLHPQQQCHTALRARACAAVVLTQGFLSFGGVGGSSGAKRLGEVLDAG